MHASSNTASPRHAGPHPGIVAVIFTALFLGSLVVVSLLVDQSHFPSPLQSPDQITRYFQTHAWPVRICAFLQFGAAIPLGIYTATLSSRMRFLGVTAAGPSIALFGGLAAACAMAGSALVTWTLSQPGIAADPLLTRALYYVVFATGGPGYSVPLGLLVAGIAVPAAFFQLLPKWLVRFGLVVAVVGELSSLSLIVPGALFLIPLTRFPAFVWLIAAGFHIPARSEASPAT
jgi:hypothetical protein